MSSPSRAAGAPTAILRRYGRSYLRDAWLREWAEMGGGVPTIKIGYVTASGELVIWDTNGEVYSAKERSECVTR